MYKPKRQHIRINESIRAENLQLIGPEGENIGVVSRLDALKRASEANLDLIEIASNTNPPVAKITDFGKYSYDLKKKEKQAKANATDTEVKTIQVKIGTGTHDLELKAKRAAEWLGEGHRIKIDLFLPGRTKYMNIDFLKERLERFMRLIPTSYEKTDEPKKSPKGLTIILEKKK